MTSARHQQYCFFECITATGKSIKSLILYKNENTEKIVKENPSLCSKESFFSRLGITKIEIFNASSETRFNGDGFSVYGQINKTKPLDHEKLYNLK
jgi:hypothetical protein